MSNFVDHIQLPLICQTLAKFSGVESERTASKFRIIIKKTKKEGSFMSRSCIDGYEMYTKRERTFGRRILGV